VEDPVIFSAVTYLMVAISLRALIPIHYLRGFQYYKHVKYENAIVEFQKSYRFFSRYRFIDRYRYVILLSSNQISYLELTLVNMAFCHEQLGSNKKAKELYLQTLSLFPDSQIAKDALKLMSDMKKA
jgi:tetratricopeptide (TPR) repeat protein